MSASDAVGTLGVSLLLLAFALSSFGLLKVESATYHGLNVVGAGLSCAASAMIGFLPFVVLEATWGLVAAVALGRLALRLRG